MEKKKTILLIDDDRDIRTLVKTILEVEGYNVVAASDGIQGIEELEKIDPNALRAIFLDVLMPGMNGLDVLVRIKANPKTQNVPVLVITTEGMMDKLINGYNLGASYYIPKPFTQEQLLYGLECV